MVPTLADWTLHDGIGTFGVRKLVNPYERPLVEAFDALSDAVNAPNRDTIAGRMRIRNAQARVRSLRAAYSKWVRESQ